MENKTGTFIEEVMKQILKPVSRDYFEKLKDAQEMDAAELYEKILSLVDRGIVDQNSEKEGTTIFPTPGCPHNVKDGHHCGCSFCDWNGSYIVHPAYVYELRRKNKQMYQEMQLECFSKIRGTGKPAHIFEEYAIHDCFDDKELNEEERAYLFDEKQVFSTMPVIGLVQVRAESVTSEKIKNWSRMARRVLTLGIGVETGSEWIRNHWLNKNLNDEALRKAVETAHRNYCKVSANILVMLPGLTMKQNMEELKSTIVKMYEFGFDSFMLSPLVVKKYTTQNYLVKNNLSNEQCIPAILELFHELSGMEAKYKKKLMFSSLNFMDYFQQFHLNQEQKKMLEPILLLLDAGGMKDLETDEITRLFDSDSYDAFHQEYKKMKGKEELKDTLLDCASQLGEQVLEVESREQQMELFSQELEKWDGK